MQIFVKTLNSKTITLNVEAGVEAGDIIDLNDYTATALITINK